MYPNHMFRNISSIKLVYFQLNSNKYHKHINYITKKKKKDCMKYIMLKENISLPINLGLNSSLFAYCGGP